MTSMTSRYAELSRDQLAKLVPELLLIGQMIDVKIVHAYPHSLRGELVLAHGEAPETTH